ncbi:MAG: hypothetical protein KME14_00865 [Tildeniella torsiva UHER 1998/13D]|nr:hypothetical protein [Tildeniella torsiva UHER 1998/13D]
MADQGGVWRQARPKKPQSIYNSPELITQFTPEQKATLAKLSRKWRDYTLSNQPIDRSLVSAIICAAYRAVAHTQYINALLEKPRILFFDPPDAACQELLKQWMIQKQIEQRKSEQRILIERKLWDRVLRYHGISEEIDPALREQHYNQRPSLTWSHVWERMEQKLYGEYSANYWANPPTPFTIFSVRSKCEQR